MSESPPITLVVAPARVELTGAKQREIEAALRAIDGKGDLKIVAGTYGKWAHKFVPPDSAQGKLLAFGFDAVPVLLHALDDEDLSPRRRQVFLSVLYSLTGENNPTEEAGVTGAFNSVAGHWLMPGGGVGGSGWSFDDRPIDPKKQAAFAKRWEPWKQYIRVERPPAVN